MMHINPANSGSSSASTSDSELEDPPVVAQVGKNAPQRDVYDALKRLGETTLAAPRQVNVLALRAGDQRAAHQNDAAKAMDEGSRAFLKHYQDWAASPGRAARPAYPAEGAGKSSLDLGGAVPFVVYPRCEFKDRLGINRTRDLKHFKGYHKSISYWTGEALRAYTSGNSTTFAERICSHPLVITSDLERFSPGPLYDARVTAHVVQAVYRELHNGVDRNRDLFEGAVKVVANNILTDCFIPPKTPMGNDYRISSVDTLYKKTLSEMTLIQDMSTSMSPNVFSTIGASVYANALMTALIVKASRQVAMKFDDRNDDHAKHVTLTVATAFAIIKAITGGASLGVADSLTNLLDPISTAVENHEAGHYTNNKIVALVDIEIERIKARAASGYFVPGLNNDARTLKKMAPVVGLSDKRAVEKEARKNWGIKFNEYLDDILK